MGYKTEVCCTIDRHFRLTEDNYWFKVEERGALGKWYTILRTRDMAIAHRWMTNQYWAHQAELIRDAHERARTAEEFAAVAAMEAQYVAQTGHQVPH